MYNNPSYQSPPESCPSPRGEIQPGDLAQSHGGTRTRAAASDFGAGGRAGPRWLRDSRRLQPSRGATHSGPGRGPAPSPPPRLPSAFLTRNPEAKKKQPSGRRVSIHSPVRLSVRPSSPCSFCSPGFSLRLSPCLASSQAPAEPPGPSVTTTALPGRPQPLHVHKTEQLHLSKMSSSASAPGLATLGRWVEGCALGDHRGPAAWLWCRALLWCGAPSWCMALSRCGAPLWCEAPSWYGALSQCGASLPCHSVASLPHSPQEIWGSPHAALKTTILGEKSITKALTSVGTELPGQP